MIASSSRPSGSGLVFGSKDVGEVRAGPAARIRLAIADVCDQSRPGDGRQEEQTSRGSLRRESQELGLRRVCGQMKVESRLN